jgi:hypothetical protein
MLNPCRPPRRHPLPQLALIAAMRSSRRWSAESRAMAPARCRRWCWCRDRRAQPVVPILAVGAYHQLSRMAAFRRLVDPRRAAIALAAAVPTCARCLGL